MITHFSPSPDLAQAGSIVAGNGPFGTCLFFGVDGNHSCLSGSDHMYELLASDDDFIEANSFFYHDDCDSLDSITAEIIELTGCDDEQAQGLLDGSEPLWDLADELELDPCDVGEMDWEIQAMQAKAARILGFLGAKIRDENGTVMVADMLGKESLLKKIN